MPIRTPIATRSALVLAAAALTVAAVRGARPAADGLRSRYGAPVAMGNGQARTYVVVDAQSGNPVEVGVALSARALERLPTHSPDHGPGTHGPYSEYLLDLPADNPTPYRFVELDWNPHGHGGPYTAPHFDFHFYRVPVTTRTRSTSATPTSPPRRFGCPPRTRSAPAMHPRTSCWARRPRG
jgi:hypothetical protein